jgi:hypothetical protein
MDSLIIAKATPTGCLFLKADFLLSTAYYTIYQIEALHFFCVKINIS